MRPQPAHAAFCLLSYLLGGTMAFADPGHGAVALPRSLPAAAVRDLPNLPPQVDGVLPAEALGALPAPRLQQAQALARQYPRELEIDRLHGLRVRGEILALDPSPAALDAATAAGFRIGETRELAPLGLRLVVLHPTARMGTRRALARLAELDPAGTYTLNHVYLGGAAALSRETGAEPAFSPGPPVRNLRVGLVDGGVEATHPAMASTRVLTWGCQDRPQASAHGTAVASLLAGNAGGELSDAVLYAADIYCGEPTGGAVMQLVQALAWLANERVAVVNVSLVGPDNPLLARAVQQMHARGHVIVSAVGNDGPRSPPLYPAAYPEVIGVTAVDERDRLLPEAVRGPHARFATSGVRLRAAGTEGKWLQVRGTSFASALVARQAADALPTPGMAAFEATIARLRSLSRPGKTPGVGILGPLSLPEPVPAGRARE